MSSAPRHASAQTAGHLQHARFELAKWVAIATMTVDHYGKIVDPSFYHASNAVGRLAFPLFAWIIGSRLAIDTGLARRYLWHLIPWAIATQPVYVWVGKSWGDPNIFFTLAMGVALHLAVSEWKNNATSGLLIAGVLAFLALGADYGVLGLLMIPVIARLNALNPTLGISSVGPLGVLGNLLTRPPYLGPGALWALLASVIAWLSIRSAIPIPRLPRLLFYAYYPAHLLVLAGIARILART